MFRTIFIYLMVISTLFGTNLTDKRVENLKWESGETLLSFFEDNLIPLDLYYNMDKEEKEVVSEIYAGITYQILRNEDYDIEQILIPLTEELQLHIQKDANNEYYVMTSPISYQEEKKILTLQIENSLSNDIVDVSGNYDLFHEVMQKFKSSIDFKKLKKGDTVAIFYKEKTRLGEHFGSTVVEAAMIESHGKKEYIFLAGNGKYYNQKAKELERSYFIKPCRYKRISSKFTKKRWHPILRRYRAHLGIDYAAPIGTPVKAAYDGKVSFVGRKGGYGRVIQVKHKNGYKTLYAHLSKYKRGIKNKRVKKGQIIGYVGNSGMSTGPHLHFGLYRNNKAINPATKIKITKGLSGKDRKTFLKRVNSYKEKIEIALLQHNAPHKIGEFEYVVHLDSDKRNKSASY